MMSCSRRSLKDGIAMATRMRTGRTSGDFEDGVVRRAGGDRVLVLVKRKITAMRRPATKMQMIAMSQTSQV